MILPYGQNCSSYRTVTGGAGRARSLVAGQESAAATGAASPDRQSGGSRSAEPGDCASFGGIPSYRAVVAGALSGATAARVGEGCSPARAETADCCGEGTAGG